MDEETPRQRMLRGVTLASQVLELDGVTTNVLEGGNGPPLVLLHGGIECGGAMWAPVLSSLAERFRLVVPDVPGLGESAPLPRLDVDSFATWLTALLDHTKADRPMLVAHSLIGSLATRLATRDTSLLSRLVIYGAPAVGPYRMPLRLKYVAIRFAVRPTARNAERFDRFALLDLDATRARDPEWFDAFAAYNLARATDPNVKKTMNQLVSNQMKRIPDEQLARIDVPTALLWGRHDRMVPISGAEAAATRHGWPLHMIERAAHAPHIEQPDAFVETLAAAIGHENGHA